MLEEARVKIDPICPKCYLVPSLQGRAGQWRSLRCEHCGWTGVSRESMPAVPEPRVVPPESPAAPGDVRRYDPRHGLPFSPTPSPYADSRGQPLKGERGQAEHPLVYTYDDVLKAICSMCRDGVEVLRLADESFSRVWWSHRFTNANAPDNYRTCEANDWRRSHPR